MTKGNTLRLLLSFSIPLFIGNLFQQLYSMVDTIVVGRFVGVDALAAVGSTGGFSFMVVGFAQGLTAGFSVIVSQRFGAKDNAMMRKTYAMSILSSAVVSVFIAVMFALLSMPLLRLIDTPENIIGMANSYILIIYLGIGTAIYYNLFSSILRAVGDGRSPVYFLLISSALNIVLDLFFVIVIPLGCSGVAIATIIAQGISAVISFFYIKKRFPMFRFQKEDWKLDIPLCIRLMKIGIPGAVQFSVCAIGVIIVQAAINGFGSDTVAAYSVGGKIENVITQFFPAVGMAISTFAGQNLGAGNLERIRKGFRTSFAIMAVGAVIALGVAMVAAVPFSHIFMDKNTTSPAIIVQAAINGFGSDTVAAYSVGGKIENVITQFFPAVGMAISTFAGQNLGAGNLERIRKGFRTSFAIMAVGAVIALGVAMVAAVPFSHIFMDKSTTSPAIIEQAVEYVHTIAWFFIPLGMIFIFRTGCQGLGSGAIPMISSIAELVMRAIAAFTLPLAFGYRGICFASPVAWCGAGFILPFCYLFLMRKITRNMEKSRNS